MMMASNVVTNALFMRLMSASIAVASQAGKIIRDIMTKGDLGVVDKGINDLQTEADRLAQRCIVDSLSREFPKITIIGEETLEKQKSDEGFVNLSDGDCLKDIRCPEAYLAVKEEDVVIWVDPLDGTKEYTQGLLDHVTVLIGLAVDGKAVGGVIHQPYFDYQKQSDINMMGRTMWGIVGGDTGGIIVQPPPEGKRIITTTRSHSHPLVENTIAAMKPDEVLKVGGAGHKVLLVIEGKAHAYVFPSKGCKKWDTCAPEALLTAIGGKLTDIHGIPLKYHAGVEHGNDTGVLATHASSEHDWYCKNIPQTTRDTLPCKM